MDTDRKNMLSYELNVDGKYAIYLRKSRADIELERNGKTDTLKRHRVILFNLAKTMNINSKNIKIYEEVVSGETIKEREQMQILLANVEREAYDGVFVVEVSRLSRGDKIDQGEIAKYFKYTNTLIITPDKIYNLSNEKDEELFEDELTNSSKELKVTKKRLIRGRTSSVLEGKFVANTPPLGYTRVKIIGDKGYTLKENLNESYIIKRIFNLYAYTNIKINGIALELNKSGIKPKKSEKWSPSTIKDYLRNPTYIGMIRWNNRATIKVLKNGEIVNTRPRNHNPLIVEGLHSAIIDKKTWDIVQEKLLKNPAPIKHNNVIKNPLQHILICEKCGSYMQRRPYSKQGKEPTIICNNCDNISSKLRYVEEKIIDGLKYWFTNYQIDYSTVRKSKRYRNIDYYKDTIEQIQNEITNNKKEIDKVCEAYEKGIYTDEIYQDRYYKHLNKQKALENNLTEYQKKLNKEYINLESKELIVPKIQNIIEIYYKLESVEDKNDLLKTVVEKVTYLKDKSTLKHSNTSMDFKIKIYPKLPKT